MPDRKRLVSTIWLTCWLIMLASWLVAPTRTPVIVTVSSRPDCLCRDFALPPSHPTTCLNAAIATDAAPQMSDLASEEEEQDPAHSLDEPRISFLIFSSFPRLSDRPLIVPFSLLSLYPLRC